MKKKLFTSLILILLSFATFAQGEKEPYVVIDEEGTATFYYDDSKPEGTLPIQSSMLDSNWPDDVQESVFKVVFDDSFRDYRPTSCNYWFYDLINLKEVLGIAENLKTENVTSMSLMFFRCRNLTTLDVSNFDTKNVYDMSKLFFGCHSLTSLDVSKFNTEKVTTMESMFFGCSSLTSLDVTNFNTTKVDNMADLFGSCSGLTSLDVSNFDTKNVMNMQEMFYDCSGLTTLDLSNFNTQYVHSMRMMFYGCSSLKSLDISQFNTENVTNMTYMFNNCSSLTSIDVSMFNTENVTEMWSMFENCKSLTSLDVSNFNTEKVKNMECMFRDCIGLTSLDLNNFNTANVTNMNLMFFGCSELKSIFVDNGWVTTSVVSSDGMFSNCFKLNGGKGTPYDAYQVDVYYAHIDGENDKPGYFTKYGDPAFEQIIESIVVSIMPKTEYTEGEPFSSEFGKLKIKYNNTTATVDLSEATITGYDKAKIGEQILKVEYNGFETELKVTVKANQPTPVSSISATQASIKVWSSLHSIFIESAPDTKYTIIDLNGRTIKSATTKSTKDEISIDKSGVFVVVINGESFKVAVQ